MGDILDKADGKARKGDPVLSPIPIPGTGGGRSGFGFPIFIYIYPVTQDAQPIFPEIQTHSHT